MQPNHDDVQEFKEIYRQEFGEEVLDAVAASEPTSTTPRSAGPPPMRHRMNPLSPATVEELRTILKEDYGREVTPEQASEIAHTLVRYFDLLAEIYHREESLPDEDRQTSSPT